MLLKITKKRIAYFTSGEEPQFVEGDVFRIVVPINEISENGTGLSEEQQKNQPVNQQENQPVSQQEIKVAEGDTVEMILSFCSEARTRKEIAAYCGYKDLRHFSARYLNPLIEAGSLKMTIPDKPNSRLQKYVTVKK